MIPIKFFKTASLLFLIIFGLFFSFKFANASLYAARSTSKFTMNGIVYVVTPYITLNSGKTATITLNYSSSSGLSTFKVENENDILDLCDGGIVTSVSKSIGTSGGAISLGSEITITIPFGAMPYQATITITKYSLNSCINDPSQISAQPACSPNWYCGDWTDCKNGKQVRACNDLNSCGVITGIPNMTQSCVFPPSVDFKYNRLGTTGNIEQFTSKVTFYDSICKSNPSDYRCKYSWIFQNGATNITSNVANPYITALTTGSHSVWLSVFDSIGQYCGVVNTINIPGSLDYTNLPQSCSANIPACVPNWQTGAWSICVNSQQTRTVTDSNNCGTITGKPIESQYCSYCTPSWSCGAWNACVNFLQTRTCIDISNCGVLTGAPLLSQSCITPPPEGVTCNPGQIIGDVDGDGQVTHADAILVLQISAGTIPAPQNLCCVDSDGDGFVSAHDSVTISKIAAGATQSPGKCCSPNWSCGTWTFCANSNQTRICTDSNNCGIVTGKPVESQYCVPCIPLWSCGVWSACVNSKETTICTDLHNCGTTNGKPAETQSCCMQSWTCGAWSACANSSQTRICTDSNNCGGITERPPLTQSCVMPVVSSPFYRLHNGGYFLYTANEAEKSSAISTYGYTYDGIAGYIFTTRVANTFPFYRLHNGGYFLYTANEAEKSSAISTYGYTYDGIAGYIFTTQQTAMKISDKLPASIFDAVKNILQQIWNFFKK